MPEFFGTSSEIFGNFARLRKCSTPLTKDSFSDSLTLEMKTHRRAKEACSNPRKEKAF